MSGIVWAWLQADRRRGGGWTFAHLWPCDTETGFEPGAARCGYDPTRGVPAHVVFWAARDGAPRCSRCERAAEASRPAPGLVPA